MLQMHAQLLFMNLIGLIINRLEKIILITLAPGELSTSIDLSHLKNGIYFVRAILTTLTLLFTWLGLQLSVAGQRRESI